MKFRIRTPVRTIDDLPKKALYNIFYCLAGDIPLFQERLFCTLSNSWVCQKWRRIILESPDIWGRLLFFTLKQSFTPPPLISIILERSGDTSPLWIYGDTQFSVPSEYMPDTGPSNETIAASDALVPIMASIVAKHWDRIEYVALRIHSPDLLFVGPSFFEAILDRPAGNLRHLDLEVPDRSETPSVPMGRSPVLGHLSLRGLRYIFEPSNVARLRFLELRGAILGSTLHLLPKELPLLEACAIYDVSETIEERDIVPISLPKLRHLQVDGSPEACQAIIRNTDRSSPDGCFVGFEFEIPRGEPFSASDTSREMVDGFYEHHLLNNLKLLKKSGSRLQDLTLTMYSNAFEMELVTGLPHLPLKMSLFWHRMDYFQFYHRFVEVLKRCAGYFKDVDTLGLYSYGLEIMHHELFQDCLRVFPNVTTVRTLYMNFIPLAYGVWHPDFRKPSVPDQEKARILRDQPLPKLRKLNYCQESNPENPEAVLRALIVDLSRRVRLGVPIEEIELTVGMPKHFVMGEELRRVAREFPDLKIRAILTGGSSEDRRLLSGTWGARAGIKLPFVSTIFNVIISTFMKMFIPEIRRMRWRVVFTSNLTENKTSPVMVNRMCSLLERQIAENDQQRVLDLWYRVVRVNIVAAQVCVLKELDVQKEFATAKSKGLSGMEKAHELPTS
ncbi:hypothetical protein CPC08DRAFT_783182 [Agrocybe pediades]|nr:hypothetical protein CPC08DRAFT_783182 [Agrocybe pediades]